MTIAVAGATPLIVAVDGQPSAPFEPLRNLFPIAPGARFELMFDMADAAVAFSLRDDAAGEPDRPLIVFASAGAPKPARPAVRRAARQSAAADGDRPRPRAALRR